MKFLRELGSKTRNLKLFAFKMLCLDATASQNMKIQYFHRSISLKQFSLGLEHITENREIKQGQILERIR